MPTSRELVVNRPLPGTDLAKIILADTADLLAQDGFLSSHIAYGRVAYEVRLVLHFDNPLLTETTSSARSARRSDSQIEADPALAAIEPAPPLSDPSPDAHLVAVERHREIVSPNATRIENGLPIEVLHRDKDGQVQAEEIVYPADYPLADDQRDRVTTADVTANERTRLGLPSLPPDDSYAALARQQGEEE